MSDIKLQNIDGTIDLNILGVDFEKEKGLETAVLISLFSDQRVTDEELPAHEFSKRGWWGDLTSEYKIGSKLWILGRQKITKETPERISELAKEALQWMIDEGVATTIKANAYRAGTYQINLEINITRPNKEETQFNYEWNNQIGN